MACLGAGGSSRPARQPCAWHKLPAHLTLPACPSSTPPRSAMLGETPDLLVGCTGGGSNFGGLAFPFLRQGKTQGEGGADAGQGALLGRAI